MPRNLLDVLAQQIVAICAEEEIAVDEPTTSSGRAWPFRDLSREQLENVLDMLAGRYPSEEFAEPRPRITWDRSVAGAIEGVRSGSPSRTCTIPTAVLASISWTAAARSASWTRRWLTRARPDVPARRLDVADRGDHARDRVPVSWRPASPARALEGRGVGRPYELGEAIGRAGRELVALPDAKARDRLTGEHELDERGRRNLLTFLREQEQATGVFSDRTIVVERFRDEIGDWRLCILTLFGARVHALRALALAARLRESLGLEVNFIWSGRRDRAAPA